MLHLCFTNEPGVHGSQTDASIPHPPALPPSFPPTNPDFINSVDVFFWSLLASVQHDKVN